MEFTINTHDLQKTVIALINSKCCVKNSILTNEDYDRLIDMFSDMNKLCSADNDWTLSVSVNEGMPRVIVEVDGGMVQRVLADRKVDVDVLDMDNYNISDDEEEISAYEDMICETSLLQKVW